MKLKVFILGYTGPDGNICRANNKFYLSRKAAEQAVGSLSPFYGAHAHWTVRIYVADNWHVEVEK